MASFYTSVRQHRGKLLVSGYSNGKKFTRKVPFKPWLYLPTNDESEIKTLYGQNVRKMEFSSISDYRDFKKRYKDVNNFEIHGDIQPEYMFISQFGGGKNFDEKLIKVANIDIEVGSDGAFPDPKYANAPFTAITVHYNQKYHVFGNGDYEPHRDDVIYYGCTTEEQLISKFLHFWENNEIDIVTGWNIEFFDMPYIYNRIAKVCGEDEVKRLSPYGVVLLNETTRGGYDDSVQQVIDIYGIAILDYMALYKKHTFTAPESYRLDSIAELELGENKLDYSEFQNLHQLYKYDYQKYVEYNIRDVELVKKIDDKNQLISLILTMAYEFKVNYQDTFSQIRMWDSYLYDYLIRKNIAPPRKTASKKTNFPGGYVMVPKPGMYEWVMSFDLNSLYPHLIMGVGISPETLRTDLLEFSNDVNVDTVPSIIENGLPDSIKNYIKENNASLAANGYMFDRSKKGILPTILEQLYEERKKYKKMMLEQYDLLEHETDPKKREEIKKLATKYNNFQLVKKVGLNSAYGALGSNYFRYYDVRTASAVTSQGQMAIRWISIKLNEYLQKHFKTNDEFVIYSDTDSSYVHVKTIVDTYKKRKPNATIDEITDMLDQFASKVIEPFIDKSYQELCDMMNHCQQKMVMKREIIADRAIWTGKKRYIANVLDSEGIRYENPKMKVMGMEMVRSSTPTDVREKLKTASEIIIRGSESELQEFIKKYREEFKNSSFDKIAFPRSVNGIEKYIDATGNFRTGCPIHVRAAGVWNQLIKKEKLTDKYQTIGEGEKAKYLYLKLPNPTQQHVIAFLGDLPDVKNIRSYVDYDTQFEKSFIVPIQNILDVIGWNTEPKSDLLSFFG